MKNATSIRWLLILLMVGLVLAAEHSAAAPAVYDPLAVLPGETSRTVELMVRDEQRSRDIPVRVYVPAGTDPTPVILFSHGLGGTRAGSPYLGRHWAGRGYVAVFLQHPGSDDAVWREAVLGRRLTAMQEAANAKNFLLRVRDVPAVLDRLQHWNGEPGHPLRGRLDLKRVGISGHSFGAVTTQAVSGQRTAAGRVSFEESRIRAALALSPSLPRGGGDPKEAFGGVKIPWMLMTGTKDVSLIGNADAASRLAVYPALPPGGKYELVLDGAEHSAFSDRALPGDRVPRNPNHHRAILALSTAFWDAWLKEDPGARAWLDGDGPAAVMEAKDRWRRK